MPTGSCLGRVEPTLIFLLVEETYASYRAVVMSMSCRRRGARWHAARRANGQRAARLRVAVAEDLRRAGRAVARRRPAARDTAGVRSAGRPHDRRHGARRFKLANKRHLMAQRQPSPRRRLITNIDVLSPLICLQPMSWQHLSSYDQYEIERRVVVG